LKDKEGVQFVRFRFYFTAVQRHLQVLEVESAAVGVQAQTEGPQGGRSDHEAFPSAVTGPEDLELEHLNRHQPRRPHELDREDHSAKDLKDDVLRQPSDRPGILPSLKLEGPALTPWAFPLPEHEIHHVDNGFF